jgi:hypothetical protein
MMTSELPHDIKDPKELATPTKTIFNAIFVTKKNQPQPIGTPNRKKKYQNADRTVQAN